MQLWTPKRAAAKSKRKIETIKRQMLARRSILQEIANEFRDVDMFAVTCAQIAMEQLEYDNPFIDALDGLLIAISEAAKVDS